MFARPERLDPSVADIACEEFARTYRSRAARVAFFAALRQIYLDPPYGERGFWTRLCELEAPSLFVWGDSDVLVPAALLPPRRRGAAGCAPGDPRPSAGTCPRSSFPSAPTRLIAEHIESAAPAPAPVRRPRMARRLAGALARSA